MVAPDKTHAARRVAGSVQGPNLLGTKAQGVAVLELHRSGADAATRRCRGSGAGQLGQLPGAGDVVGVGMGFQRPHQFQAVVAQHLQVAFKLRVHRVDDDGFPCGSVKQHVGVTAGGSVEELNRLHGMWQSG